MSTASRFVIAIVVGVFIATFTLVILPSALGGAIHPSGPYGLLDNLFCRGEKYHDTWCLVDAEFTIHLKVLPTIRGLGPIISVLGFAIAFFVLPKEKSAKA